MEIENLQGQLALRRTDAGSTDSVSMSSLRELRQEKERLQRIIGDADRRLADQERVMEKKSVEVQKLEKRVQDLELTNKQLKAELEDKNRRLAVNAKELSQLQTQLIEKDTLTSRLKSELESVQKLLKEKSQNLALLEDNFSQKMVEIENKSRLQADKLEEKIILLQQSSLPSSSLKEKDQMISKLKETVEENLKRLEDISRDLSAEMDDNNKIHQELNEVCNENACLKMELERAREKGRSLEADVQHLREELKSSANASSEKETKISLLKQDVERVEGKLREHQSENSKLKAALDQPREVETRLRADLEAVTARASTRDSEIKRLEVVLKEASSEREEMAKKYENVVVDLESARRQVSDLEDELKIQKTEIQKTVSHTDFQKMNMEYKEMESEFDSLHKLIDSLTDECQSLKDENKEMKKNYEKKILQMQCEYGELVEEQKMNKKEIVQAQETRLVLESKLAGMRKQSDSELNAKCKEIEDGERKIRELKRQLSSKNLMEKEGSIEKEEQVGGAMEHDERLANVSRQLKKTQADQKAAEQRCCDLDSINRDLKVQLRKMEVSHEEQIGQLNGKIQELTTKLTGAERRKSRLEQRFKSESENGEAASDCSPPMASSFECSEQNQKAEILQQLLADAEQKVRELDVKLGKIEVLEKRTKELEEECHLLADNNRNLTEAIAKLKSNAGEVDGTGEHSEKEECMNALVESEKMVSSLRLMVDDLKCELARNSTSHSSEVQSLKDGYEIRIRSLLGDLEAARVDSVTSHQELIANKEKLGNLECELLKSQSSQSQTESSFQENKGRYEEKILLLEDKLKNVDQDDAVEVSKNNDDVTRLQKLLDEEREKHKVIFLCTRRIHSKFV